VHGCPTVTFDLDADFALPEDLGARAEAAGAGLFCLVNPHAPTGRLFDEGALERLLSQFSGVVLIDQAYVDFIDEDQKAAALALIQRHDRVLLLRTLSKGYALAGLRFGYGLAQPSLLEPMLTKTRDSYNVDAIAQTLATAALNDQAWAQENWAAVRREREALHAALAARGYEAPPSQTNFLFPTVPAALDAATIKEQLKAAGILVRHFPGALGQRLRITVGTAEENAALLAALPSAP
jgi:histidinol-phosphate aminotransferase